MCEKPLRSIFALRIIFFLKLDNQVSFCHSCESRNDRLFVRSGSKNLIIEF
ncbi:Uncharacterized protein dnm_094190 [Desulfonema magnum]|uniref:Uncharacterized protein n=1 Tax=Desulfonema magnum TaxID=45655 RepID=A0A975BXF0_9BACT|nr:Uncharacterized protein dnm_094190 [Desulfonema magnum]